MNVNAASNINSAPTLLRNEFEIGGARFTRTADERYVHQLQEYTNILMATTSDRKREAENLRFLYGLDDGQWPSYLNLEEMRSKGRQIGTYNLSYRKVTGIAGSITSNPFDAKFLCDDPSLDEQTRALQQAFLRDKELMDWPPEYLMCVILGLSYASWLDMTVENTRPADPQGCIALRCRQPFSTIPDPDWRSVNGKNLELQYCIGYLTARQMKDIYHVKTDEIEAELQRLRFTERLYENNEKIDFRVDQPSTVGSQYKVIEKRYLETKRVIREWDPVTKAVFWEDMSDEEKIDLAQKLDIQSERIERRSVNSKRYRVRTIVEQMQNLILEDGEHYIQIERIPSFLYTATRLNGKCLGLIDFLKDAQRQINFRVGAITYATQAAVNTGVGIDPAAWGNDQTKINEFKNNFGDPHQVTEFKPNASRAYPNAIVPLPRITVSQDLYRVAAEMIDLMDLLVPQPPAGEARTERSNESGYHYAQKLQVMKTLQAPMMNGVRILWNEIAEAYLYLACQHYKKGYRVFRVGDNAAGVAINRPAIDISTGEEYIENDFSLLNPLRVRVQIAESPLAVNTRVLQTETNLALLQAWPQNLPFSSLTFVENILKYTEMSDSDKEKAKERLALDEQLIRSRMEAQIRANTATAAPQPQVNQYQQGGMQLPEGPAASPPGLFGVATPEPAIGMPQTAAIT